MNNKIIIKGFILVVILLINSIFISSAPAIKINKNENQNNSIVKIRVTVCQSNQFQNHDVYLTRQQANKLDEIFKNIEINLKNTKSIKNYNKILFNAIIAFKDLGLITDNMRIREIIKIMKTTMNYQILARIFNKLKNYQGTRTKENLFCTLVGHTNGSHFFRNTGWPVLNIWPISINNVICYGTYPFPSESDPYPDWSPSEGWVYTQGLFGTINWKGEFYGQISHNYFKSFTFYSVIGVRCFTGLRFEQDDGWIYYYGAAVRVKLGSTKPLDPPPPN